MENDTGHFDSGKRIAGIVKFKTNNRINSKIIVLHPIIS